MQIKICGITNLDDALLCQGLGAHALGFIFYPKSRRFIPPQNASNIIRKLSPLTGKIGVFVNEDPVFINDLAKAVGLTAVQLHGDETLEQIEKIHHPVIKAFRVGPGFDFAQLTAYKNSTILLDTFSAAEPGGTGQSFDWGMIPAKMKSKIILAGGISAENIGIIARKIRPLAVDLSSSLESAPGRKDPEKLKTFFKIIKSTY